MALWAAENQVGPGCGGRESLSFRTASPASFSWRRVQIQWLFQGRAGGEREWNEDLEQERESVLDNLRRKPKIEKQLFASWLAQ